MTDAVKMRMVMPFQCLDKQEILFTKSGQRLNLVRPFGETNVAAMQAWNMLPALCGAEPLHIRLRLARP